MGFRATVGVNPDGAAPKLGFESNFARSGDPWHRGKGPRKTPHKLNFDSKPELGLREITHE